MMNSVLSLPINTRGRDIVVGDIHGEFRQLKQSLQKVGFDKNIDRIISVGDLVDKGEDSESAFKWLDMDYFFPVFGNHDAQFAFIDHSDLFKENISCYPVDPWFADYSQDKLRRMAKFFMSRFYPAAQVQTQNGLVGFTHAATPIGMEWSEIVHRLNAKDYDLLHYCMWNRDIPKEIIRNLKDGVEMTNERQQEVSVPGLKHIFHGHTPSRDHLYRQYSTGNRYYIDTGAFKAKKREKYPYAGIVLFDINNPTTPIYTPYNKSNKS